MKFICFFCFTLFISCVQKDGEPDPEDRTAESAILSVMEMQENAWNEGNINAFMEGYLKTEELTFIGSSGVQNGWRETIARYKRTYPDKEAMGQLTFEIISLKRISELHFHMIGQYSLARTNDQLSGIFSLIWEEVSGKWLIIADHTC